jgi:hypothetical protein
VVDARVEDALAHDLPGSFKVMRRDQTVDAAQAAFTTAIEEGRPRLYAIVITENGKSTETPIGLITPWDLIQSS